MHHMRYAIYDGEEQELTYNLYLCRAKDVPARIYPQLFLSSASFREAA